MVHAFFDCVNLRLVDALVAEKLAGVLVISHQRFVGVNLADFLGDAGLRNAWHVFSCVFVAVYNLDDVLVLLLGEETGGH